MRQKRENGRFFTEGNPFGHPAFHCWARSAGLPGKRVLEPFAGANGLIRKLEGLGLCRDYASFDIEPAARDVRERDTLARFPRGYEVCVTNPPWLAKNSARFRGLRFPDCPYDDLYKLALDRCLRNCPQVAALIPESFIRAGLFRSRLVSFVSLTARMFEETGHPVGLALFGPDWTADVTVWSGDERVGTLAELERLRPRPRPQGVPVRFNDPDGNVGFIALDNTREASIRFCRVEELAGYQVKPTGRHITKLRVEGPIRIQRWNSVLNRFREATSDVLMTCYKGIRKDGRYRRRCDWALARGIIHSA